MHPMTESTEPKLQPVFVGVARHVTLLATVLSNGEILWSADALDAAGNGYNATGSSIEEAAQRLGQTLAFHAQPIAGNDG